MSLVWILLIRHWFRLCRFGFLVLWCGYFCFPLMLFVNECGFLLFLGWASLLCVDSADLGWDFNDLAWVSFLLLGFFIGRGFFWLGCGFL